MNKKSQMVFCGYLDLSNFEKEEVLKALKEYNDLDPEGKQRKELVTGISVALKMELGPMAEGCPCCGR